MGREFLKACALIGAFLSPVFSSALFAYECGHRLNRAAQAAHLTRLGGIHLHPTIIHVGQMAHPISDEIRILLRLNDLRIVDFVGPVAVLNTEQLGNSGNLLAHATHPIAFGDWTMNAVDTSTINKINGLVVYAYNMKTGEIPLVGIPVGAEPTTPSVLKFATRLARMGHLPEMPYRPHEH